MIRIPSLARLALPAAVTVALGFGATQALARPAEAAAAAPAQACLKFQCMTYCQSRGGEGFCFNDTCFCRIWYP
jgi:hypothetical protein